VTVSPYFAGFILVWFFAWGFLLLKFPAQCHRVMSWGRTPDERQTKRARFVGYMALFFGGLFVIELAFGLVN
jgi:hypothetical protein